MRCRVFDIHCRGFELGYPCLGEALRQAQGERAGWELHVACLGVALRRAQGERAGWELHVACLGVALRQAQGERWGVNCELLPFDRRRVIDEVIEREAIEVTDRTG